MAGQEVSDARMIVLRAARRRRRERDLMWGERSGSVLHPLQPLSPPPPPPSILSVTFKVQVSSRAWRGLISPSVHLSDCNSKNVSEHLNEIQRVNHSPEAFQNSKHPDSYF